MGRLIKKSERKEVKSDGEGLFTLGNITLLITKILLVVSIIRPLGMKADLFIIALYALWTVLEV